MTQLIRNVRAVFECIRQAGLKLTIEKCDFRVTEVELLGRTITPQGIVPQDHKIQKFLANVRLTMSKKQVQRYIGFVNYYRTHNPRLSETVLGFYEHLKADKQIKGDGRSARQLQSDQRSTSRSMQIGSQANNHRTPIRPNDG